MSLFTAKRGESHHGVFAIDNERVIDVKANCVGPTTNALFLGSYSCFCSHKKLFLAPLRLHGVAHSIRMARIGRQGHRRRQRGSIGCG